MVLLNFSAVKLPGEEKEWLYAGSYPRSNDDYMLLKEKFRVSHIINLTPEIPIPDEMIGLFTFTRIPVEDYEPPTLDQAQQFVSTLKVTRDAGEKAFVHCHAGMGRTGTMLACWVLANDGTKTAGDAITGIRQLRPGSIDTDEQEESVFRFAKNRANIFKKPYMITIGNS